MLIPLYRAAIYCFYFPTEKKTVLAFIDLGTFYPINGNRLNMDSHTFCANSYRSPAEQDQHNNLKSHLHRATYKVSAEWRQVLRYVKISGFTFFFLIFSIGGFLFFFDEQHFVVRLYGTILGVIAMLFAIWQYIPQIWIVWKNSAIGSLSVSAMLIQVPGIH